MITRFFDKIRLLFLFLFFLAPLSGCETESGETSLDLIQPDMHNSMISLDWSGTYQGVIPCADCEGVDTKITITDDLTYQIERIYMGRSEQVFRNEGTFFWSDDGSRIQLNNQNHAHAPGTYQVGENRLFQLDMDGNRIEGNLAEQYILTKVIDNLSGLQWELIELDGSIISIADTLPTPVLHFISDETKITGNGGCNQFNGSYEIKSENRFSFSEIASTKMSCDHIDTEYKYFEALEKTDHYTLKHDTLSLNGNDRMPLARFLLLDEQARN